MAVINDPTVAANVARVGPVVYQPQHVMAGPFPVLNGGAYRASAPSGTMTAGMIANSEIFQFRYVTANSRKCLIHGVSISAGLAVAATAAAMLSFRMTVARTWSAVGTGGTRLTLTGNNQKLRSNFATSEVNDIGISTISPLVAGTKTLDAQDIGSVFYSALTGALTTAVGNQLVANTNLFGDFTGGMAYPLILDNQEGFVIRSGPAQPATMTWGFLVNVAWSEVESF